VTLQQAQGKFLTPVLMLPVLAATAHPVAFTPEQQQRRSRLIQQTGTALRADPTVIRLRSTMTPTPPRAVWLDFTLTDDLTPYCLTFPNTAPTVTLWMPGRFASWETLASWVLAEFATGANLWQAVKAILDAPEMDVLHRWLEDAGGVP
jgi:hypothetical protein